MKRSLVWSEKFDWEPMSSKDHGVLGALLLRAVMSIPADADTKEGFFESRKVQQSRTKIVNYLGYTKTGLKYRDKLQEAANRLAYKPMPMLSPPMDWSDGTWWLLLRPPMSSQRWYMGLLLHNHLLMQ